MPTSIIIEFTTQGHDGVAATYQYVTVYGKTCIVAYRPGTPGTVPDLEALSRIPKFPGLSRIFKDLQIGLGS